MAPHDTPRPTATEQQAQREIAHEQEFVDVVHRRLEESAEAARALAREGMGRGQLGHEGGLVERDAMVYQAARRIAALDAAHEGLVFGRLDLREDAEPRYIGRIGVRDAEREVLLVDWRAPAAAVFYQATAQDPAGVVRRRVLRSRGARVVGVEDDLLDAEHAPDDLVVVGEGALLASLSRARDSTMHSVVATIQKEQDAAIRAPSRGVTSIGGGPGTGKTVVALHRAAYLLYSDRRRYESGGVLVVGPSGVFMGYIERVLPSLGETSVTLRSLGEVVDGIRTERHDTPAVAAVKGSEPMARVLARAVRGSQPGEPEAFRYFYKDDVLRLDAADLRRVRARLLASGQRRNQASSKAAAALVDALWEQVAGERALEKDKEGFVETITSDSAFVDFVDAWWPPLDAVQAWRALADRDRLTAVAREDLQPAEVDALVASWTDQTGPSVQDVPLLDELRYLLGEVPPADDGDDDPFDVKQLMSFERRERDDRDEVERLRATGSIEDDGYAHVLVDEAQDLSPMQWRMLGRRGRYATWTIVGDPAQSSWPRPQEAARARADALSGLAEHVFRLSTNYRNSAEVFALAADVARVAIPDADLPDAVRRTGVPPEHRLVGTGLLEDVAHAVREVAAAVDGTIAVVVPGPRADEVATALAPVLDALDGRARVLDGIATKGLEFDAVVVVEPDEVVAESPAGWRTLYVVLTRATQRLVTVGSTRRWLDRVDPDRASA